MTFNDLGVDQIFIDRLKTINIINPTPIQELCIAKILNGSNILAISQTGSGKTLSFLLPILQILCKTDSCDDKKALILAPTRELVQQIGAVCELFSEELALNYATIYGGVEYAPQLEKLSDNPSVIISTVGRLQDLIRKGSVNLDNLRFFLLDEVDQMLDLGFRDSILELSKLINEKTSFLSFSATLPQEVEAIVREIDSEVEIAKVENQQTIVRDVEQIAYFVSKEMMDALLIHIFRVEKPLQSVIFTRSRKMADRLVGLLKDNGFESEAMHSDRSQVARDHIMERFKAGTTTIIVATDIIARGIDIDTITHVINYGLPQNVEQYIHRIGRTARAGRKGKALSMCSVEDKSLLENICKSTKRNIPVDNTHPYITLDVIKALNGSKNEKKSQKKGRKRG